MEAIDSLNRNLVLVIIAHRLSTLKRCDRIIQLDKGKVVASGSPSEIL